MKNKNNICVVFSHHKLGDLIWQLPYIEAISKHFETAITLVVREKTQAKDILKDSLFIKEVKYNNFRKKIYYFFEVFKLFAFFRKNNFTHIFFLDKINRPAIAAFLAGTKNRIGLGINNQKRWITNKNTLDKNDKNLNQSDQSKKFLEINNIKVNNLIPSLYVNSDRLKNIEPNLSIFRGKKIALGVDSFEDFIWSSRVLSPAAGGPELSTWLLCGSTVISDSLGSSGSIAVSLL